MNFKKKNLVYEAVKLDKIFPPDITRGMSFLFLFLALFFFLILFKPGFLGLSSDHAFGLFILCILGSIKGAICLAFLNDLKRDFLTLINKIDIKNENIENFKKYYPFPKETLLEISALKKQGLDIFQQKLQPFCKNKL